MAKSVVNKVLNAQSGTGTSSEVSFNGDVLTKHMLSVTTSAAGSALVIEIIDPKTGQEILSHTATSTELSDKAWSFSADGYPLQSVKVNVATNTGAGNITVVYAGVM